MPLPRQPMFYTCVIPPAEQERSIFQTFIRCRINAEVGVMFVVLQLHTGHKPRVLTSQHLPDGRVDSTDDTQNLKSGALTPEETT